MLMNFPLQLRFKTFAIAPQLSVTDADGVLRLYVRQKLFRLKEAVNVYADAAQNRLLYRIAADRVLDFSAQYHFTGAQGARLGAVRRRGMRSFWRAHYEITRDGREVLRIQEQNPWTKVIDNIVGEIPVLGLVSAYLFHPTYLVSRTDGTAILQLTKQPALMEGRYEIRALGAVDESEAELAVLGLIMMVLLERERG
jgi:hypothetical protein